MNATLSLSFRAAQVSEIDELLALDEDAGALFIESGLVFDSPTLDAYVAAERTRWTEAAARGAVELAVDQTGYPVGFVALTRVDGQPYLEQLSVRRRCMQRGVGRALLARAIARSRPLGDLWLTTYAHVAWNAPMYRRMGFELVPEEQCGPGILALLREQRSALPDPEQRIAMRRRSSRPPER